MADNKDIAGEEGGGSKKKLLIIIAAAAVLLIGGGVAAYFLLAGGDEPSADGTGAQTAKVAEAEPVDEGPAIYHEMKPTFVVNLPPGGPAKMLQISVQVLTYNADVDALLTTHDPMLRHHLANLFEAQQGADLLTLEGKQALQQAVHDLLSEQLKKLHQSGTIKGVYFSQFVLQ